MFILHLQYIQLYKKIIKTVYEFLSLENVGFVSINGSNKLCLFDSIDISPSCKRKLENLSSQHRAIAYSNNIKIRQICQTDLGRNRKR
jgi:hypothetical protein